MALSEAAKKAIIRAIAKSKARREKDAKAWAEKGVLPETSNSVSVRLKTGTLEEIADFLKTIAPDLLQCGNVMWPKSNAWGLSFPHSMSAEEAEKDRQWTAYARTFAR